MADLSSCWAYLLPDPEHSLPTRSLLVVGYVAAALCWLRAGRRARLETGSPSMGWWYLGAILLFLLAFNKQFGLRGVFEAGFRALAKAGGWYDRRRPMQFVVAIVVPSALAILTAAVLALKAKGFARRHPLALVGWVLLLLYLTLRQTQEWKPMLPLLSAIRYHDWRLALEVAGMLLVTLPALSARPSPPAGASPPGNSPGA